MNPSIADQVGQAASLLGLLLALDTLFTSDQARRLTEERARQGGPRRTALRSIFWTALSLAVLTAAAILFLAPLVLDVWGTIGEPAWEPVLGVFALTYVLLLGLVSWQIGIARGCRRG